MSCRVFRMPALVDQPGYAQAKLSALTERVPCREAQASMLLAFLGEVGNLTFIDDVRFNCF